MDKLHSISRIASMAVSAWRFVDTTGGHAATAVTAIGISEQAAEFGKMFSALTGYSGPVEAAEALNAGDLVKPAADGSGRAVRGAPGDCCGRVLASAASGKLAEVAFLDLAAVSGSGSVRPATYSLGSLLAKWDTAPGAGTLNATRIIDGSNAAPDADAAAYVVRLPYVAGNGAVYDHIPASAIDLSVVNTLGFWACATPRADGERYSTLKFIFAASTADFASFGNVTISVRADGRYRFHVLNTAAIAVGAGAWSTATPVARIRMREGDAGGSTNRPQMTTAGEAIFIGPMRANPRQRPMATIRFDDGLSSLYTSNTVVVTNAFVGQSGVTVPAGNYSFASLLALFGFVGNAYVLTDLIGAAGFETIAGLRALQNLGWDICFQSAANPVGGINAGVRLLGPYGYNLVPPGTITALNTGTGVCTTAAERGIGGTTTGQTFPVIAIGTDLPPELQAGTTYYLYRLTATTFTIHSTPAGAWDGVSGKIIPSAAGTLANWGFRYKGSTNDHTAIQAEFVRGTDWLKANGFTGARHYAPNQGAWDSYSELAVFASGLFDTVHTTSLVSNVAGLQAGGAASMPIFEAAHHINVSNDVTSASAKTVPAGWLNIPSTIQTDSPGSGAGEAVVRAYVRACVARGHVFGNFHHGLAMNTPNLDLLYYIDELKVWSDRGMLDVGRISDHWARIAAARDVLSRS